jgi:hypothetical protein
MAKSFTAQVLSRTRSSRKSTRAVEESLLVVLALDTLGLSGEVGLGSKTGGDNGTGRQPVEKALRIDFFGGLLRTYTDGIHFAGMMEMYSSMRVAELKQEPRFRGLRSGGTKPVTEAARR